MAEEDKAAKSAAEEEERAEAREEAPEEPEEDAGEEGAGTEEEAEKIPMTVTVEEEGPCRRRVTVEIPAERVAEDIRKGLKDIKVSVPMPGFRKGRVPTSLLVRRFGSKVKEEVRATLVSEGAVQSLEREKIRAFSMPEFDDEALEAIEVDEAKPLTFSFSVDVKPEIEVDNYLGLEVERPKVEVAGEEVERELEALRQRRARLAPVEEGAVEPGDTLVVNREYTYRKKAVHLEENVSVQVPPEGSDLFEKVAWLKDLVGKKSGEALEHPVKFPDDFPEASVRGRSGRATLTVLDIKRTEMPALDAAFLEDVGASSEEDLKGKIEAQLKAAKDRLADRIAEERLVDALLGRIPIDLPGAVVEREVDHYLKRYEVRLREQKVPEDEVASQVARLGEQRRKAVEKEFRAFFLLEEIARKEKIFATEEEVDRRVEAMAMNYGKWPSQMREEMEAAGLLGEVRNQVKEEKVRAFLREKAKMKEGPPLSLDAEAAGVEGEAGAEGEEGGEGDGS